MQHEDIGNVFDLARRRLEVAREDLDTAQSNLKEEKQCKHKRRKLILRVLLVIWIVKIGLCVWIRESANTKFAQMYAKSEHYNLHIDRKIHFFSLKYGIFGISYHYTVDCYDYFHPSRFIGTDDKGIFRISLLHYGYIQEYWPIYSYTDDGLTLRVQETEE